MLKFVLCVVVVVIVFVIVFIVFVFVQDLINVIGFEGDWIVFLVNSFKECWVVLVLKFIQNIDSSGNLCEVIWGDICLYVVYCLGGVGEVLFLGGYFFVLDLVVDVNVGGQMFKMFIDGESVWIGLFVEDGKLVLVLWVGFLVVIIGCLVCGMVIKDMFSLLGIIVMINQV